MLCTLSSVCMHSIDFHSVTKHYTPTTGCLFRSCSNCNYIGVQSLQDVKQAASTLAQAIQHGKSSEQGCPACSSEKDNNYISNIRIQHGSWIEQTCTQCTFKVHNRSTLRSSSFVPVKNKIQIYM